MQDRRQVEHAVHGDPASRGDRQPRPARRMPRGAHRARRRRARQRGRLPRRRGQRATPEGARRLRGLQRRRDLAAAAAVGVGEISAWAGELQRSGRPQFLPPHRLLRLGRVRPADRVLARRDARRRRRWTKPGTIRSAASPAATTSRWRHSTCRASRLRASRRRSGDASSASSWSTTAAWPGSTSTARTCRARPTGSRSIADVKDAVRPAGRQHPRRRPSEQRGDAPPCAAAGEGAVRGRRRDQGT